MGLCRATELLQSSFSTSRPLLAAISLFGAILILQSSPISAAEPRIYLRGNSIFVDHHDRPALEYRFAPNSSKPFLASWHSPADRELLRNAPPDHANHHGLMFGLGVDQIDFGHEGEKNLRPRAGVVVAGNGRQVPRAPRADARQTPSGTEMVDQLIDWVAPDNRVLLTEHRRIAWRAVENPYSVSLLTWQCELKPAPDHGGVQLWGEHYYGLGMRLAAEFDRMGAFRSADAKPATIVREHESLLRGNWCAYEAQDDKLGTTTILLFDHTDNVRPATWFTMIEPFTYVSATLALHEQRLRLDEDGSLNLVYGCASVAKSLTRDEIDTLYKQWAATVPAQFDTPRQK